MLVIIIRHMHIVVVCVILFVAALLSELLLSILREESMYSPQLVTAKVDNRFCIAKYLQNNPLLPPWATPKGVAHSGRRLIQLLYTSCTRHFESLSEGTFSGLEGSYNDRSHHLCKVTTALIPRARSGSRYERMSPLGKGDRGEIQ